MGLLLVQEDKPWYKYYITHSIHCILYNRFTVDGIGPAKLLVLKSKSVKMKKQRTGLKQLIFQIHCSDLADILHGAYGAPS